MRRAALGFSTIVAVSAATSPASAAPPDAAKIRLAGEEFDAGARAYRNKEFESAASHFEAADDAVPGGKALRLAIRARAEAGQGSRAATLAALALARYGDDAETAKVARDKLEASEPILFKVDVRCASPCLLAAGTRSIHGDAATKWVVYLDPGKVTLSASFAADRGSASADVDAVAGGATEVRFAPEAKAAAAPPPPFETPEAHHEASKPQPVPDEAPPQEESGGSGLPPYVFVGGAVVTAGLAGVTIWSGLDAQNNPGVDAVRAACAGKSTDCPEYQDGVGRQNRTNALLVATAGVGVATIVVGAFFTRWHGGDAKEAPAASAIVPSIAVGGGSGAVTLAGRF